MLCLGRKKLSVGLAAPMESGGYVTIDRAQDLSRARSNCMLWDQAGASHFAFGNDGERVTR